MGAFLDIHRAWQRLGYPFDALVPSYATAIGSSADRPAALAELMGILVNDGYRMPMVRVEEIEAATQTPYEVSFSRKSPDGERVLSPEIAGIVKELLFDVVRKARPYGASRSFVRADGTEISSGGKDRHRGPSIRDLRKGRGADRLQGHEPDRHIRLHDRRSLFRDDHRLCSRSRRSAIRVYELSSRGHSEGAGTEIDAVAGFAR